MKAFTSILPDKKANKAAENTEEMTLLMKTIKAVHQAAGNPALMTPEELSRQRSEMELFSKLVTPVLMLNVKSFTVGEIPCEWVSPEYPHRKDKVILYCHGGGYTCGKLGYARILANKLATHTGIETVSFEYRLAPENPYPAQIEDALKVWDHLMMLGYGANNVFLAGDSAGGNLALELVLKLKEQRRLLPGALILMSPWTDMRAESSTYESLKDKDPTITKDYVLSVRSAYAGPEADFEDPALSPLFADLEGFPPTLIQVGSNEILRDDSEKLAKKLMKADSYAKLEVYTGGWHVFQQMPIPKAAHALDSVRDFITKITEQ